MKTLAVIGALLIIVGLAFGGYKISLEVNNPYTIGLIFGTLDAVLIFIFTIMIGVD
jgi:hypothetical protein